MVKHQTSINMKYTKIFEQITLLKKEAIIEIISIIENKSSGYINLLGNDIFLDFDEHTTIKSIDSSGVLIVNNPYDAEKYSIHNLSIDLILNILKELENKYIN